MAISLRSTEGIPAMAAWYQACPLQMLTTRATAASAPPLHPEEPVTEGRLLGDFVVRDRLGEGGSAVVYRADQPRLGREAVVKILADRASPAAAARFELEARLAARFDHP